MSPPAHNRRVAPFWYDALPSGKPESWCGYALGWDSAGTLVQLTVLSPAGCRTAPPLPGRWRCGVTFRDGRSTWVLEKPALAAAATQDRRERTTDRGVRPTPQR